MAQLKSFRVGRVTVYVRGCVWYLRYHENGQRRQVRATPDKHAARQLAAQVNAQLEVGAPAATSFEPVSAAELRQRWLDHHEHVLRSSVATINRYRTATDHLLSFLGETQPVKQAAHFRPGHAEAFVRHLRMLEIAPNGHPHTAKRRLRDNGIKYILEVCRTLFNFALKRRHLPPYAQNPFTAIEIDRMPVEDAKPIEMLTPQQERAFLDACDDWQFPIFLTLMLTGLRPGELTHLLLPDDLDLEQGWLHVRNKPELGWQVKTRSERKVPLGAELAEVLRQVVGDRATGPVFLRRRIGAGKHQAALSGHGRRELGGAVAQQVQAEEGRAGRALTRQQRQRICHRLWVDLGGVESDRLRVDFMRLTQAIGLPGVTAPKVLRHMFATGMQDANVDPLIRSQLMGHVPAGGSGPLAMTTLYTHTQPATLRRQLELALRDRPALDAARRWLHRRREQQVAA